MVSRGQLLAEAWAEHKDALTIMVLKELANVSVHIHWNDRPDVTEGLIVESNFALPSLGANPVVKHGKWHIVLKEASSASGSAGASQPAGLQSSATRSRRKPASARSRSPRIHDRDAHEAPAARRSRRKPALSRSRSPRIHDRDAHDAPAARRDVRDRLSWDIHAKNIGQSQKCKLSWEDVKEGIRRTTPFYQAKGMEFVTADFEMKKLDPRLHEELILAKFFPGKGVGEREKRRKLFCEKFFGPYEKDGLYRLKATESTKWILEHERFSSYFHRPTEIPERAWPKHLGKVLDLVEGIEDPNKHSLFERRKKIAGYTKKISAHIFKSCGQIGESIADYVRTELKREASRSSKNKHGFENTKNWEYEESLTGLCSPELEQRVRQWVTTNHYLSNPSKVQEKIGDLFEFACFYFFINGRLDLIMEIVVDQYMRTSDTADDDMVNVLRYENDNRRGDAGIEDSVRTAQCKAMKSLTAMKA